MERVSQVRHGARRPRARRARLGHPAGCPCRARQAAEQQWQSEFDAYANVHPELAAEFQRRLDGRLPEGWATMADAAVADIVAAGESVATQHLSLFGAATSMVSISSGLPASQATAASAFIRGFSGVLLLQIDYRQERIPAVGYARCWLMLNNATLPPDPYIYKQPMLWHSKISASV